MLTLPTVILSIPRLDRAHIPRDVTQGVVIGDSLALVWFALFVGTAVCLRRRVDTHKRLMVLASIAILYPEQARIGDMLGNPPLAIVGGTIALCLSMAIYDYVSRRRLHSATVTGGLLIVFANPLLMACLSALDAHYQVGRRTGQICRLRDSNPRPPDYKSGALPTVLSRHGPRVELYPRSVQGLQRPPPRRPFHRRPNRPGQFSFGVPATVVRGTSPAGPLSAGPAGATSGDAPGPAPGPFGHA